MLRHVSVILLFLLSGPLLAQKEPVAGVDRSVWGAQTGFWGIWGHYELRLTNTIALRTEAGLDLALAGGAFYQQTMVALIPTLALEPRWYYNLNRRSVRNKRVTGNCGNFFTVRILHLPDWFVISNVKDVSASGSFAVVPTWGIRRPLGRNWIYELGMGLFYDYPLPRNQPVRADQLALAPYIRIGYWFRKKDE